MSVHVDKYMCIIILQPSPQFATRPSILGLDSMFNLTEHVHVTANEDKDTTRERNAISKDLSIDSTDSEFEKQMVAMIGIPTNNRMLAAKRKKEKTKANVL